MKLETNVDLSQKPEGIVKLELDGRCLCVYRIKVISCSSALVRQVFWFDDYQLPQFVDEEIVENFDD